MMVVQEVLVQAVVQMAAAAEAVVMAMGTAAVVQVTVAHRQTHRHCTRGTCQDVGGPALHDGSGGAYRQKHTTLAQ